MSGAKINQAMSVTMSATLNKSRAMSGTTSQSSVWRNDDIWEE